MILTGHNFGKTPRHIGGAHLRGLPHLHGLRRVDGHADQRDHPGRGHIRHRLRDQQERQQRRSPLHQPGGHPPSRVRLGAPGDPYIVNNSDNPIQPSAARVGDTITIYGMNFGLAKGSSEVYFTWAGLRTRHGGQPGPGEPPPCPGLQPGLHLLVRPRDQAPRARRRGVGERPGHLGQGQEQRRLLCREQGRRHEELHPAAQVFHPVRHGRDGDRRLRGQHPVPLDAACPSHSRAAEHRDGGPGPRPAPDHERIRALRAHQPPEGRQVPRQHELDVRPLRRGDAGQSR